MDERQEHKTELQRFGLFVFVAVLLALYPYARPEWRSYRPWFEGEPLPLLGLLAPGSSVVETSRGEVEALAQVEEEPEEQLDPRTAHLPRRPPAHRTPLDSWNQGQLEHFFQELHRLEVGEESGVVRVLHWGDSTIAADGITGQVRRRFQKRFGDGGPGFLAIQVDRRWGYRPGILRTSDGDWRSMTITFAGAELPRYGLAGTLSLAEESSTAVLGGPKSGGQRQKLHSFDLHYAAHPGGGSLDMRADGGTPVTVETASKAPEDRFRRLEVLGGARTLSLETAGDGEVQLYGLALETRGPGVTWESLGVAGASIGSFLVNQERAHLKAQVTRRAPALVVYQTGGNELTYPGLHRGDGEIYEQSYREVMMRLRAGAPKASCLVVGPLDQGVRDRGRVLSKPELDRMVRVQQRAANSLGCAFWDARHAMGGSGGFARWLAYDPPYAWADLMHLTLDGLDIVGDCLADALLDAYRQWGEARAALVEPPKPDAAP